MESTFCLCPRDRVLMGEGPAIRLFDARELERLVCCGAPTLDFEAMQRTMGGANQRPRWVREREDEGGEMIPEESAS